MTKGERFVILGLSMLPLIFVLVMFPSMPEVIPIQFGLNGVTRYGNRIEIFSIPIAAIVMQIIWLLIEKLTMRRPDSGEQNSKMLIWCNLTLTFIFIIVSIWLVFAVIDGAEALTEGRFDLEHMLAVIFSVMCIGIGNLLPKCKQNKLIGIRFSWTLNSEFNWFKTHRFGGRAYIIYGITATPLCLFLFDGRAGLLFTAAGILFLLVVTLCYSYHIHRYENTTKQQKEREKWQE